MTTINDIKTLAGGTIFTAVNVTHKGQRKFICRLGVRKHLKGGELPYNPAEKDLLPVFDMKIKQYRMLNLKTLKYLKVRGRVLVNLMESEI